MKEIKRKKEAGKKVLINLNQRMCEILDKRCEVTGCTRSEYIRGLIRNHLMSELEKGKDITDGE